MPSITIIRSGSVPERRLRQAVLALVVAILVLVTGARSSMATANAAAPGCVVPKVRGLSLRKSERKIRHAHCRIGHVRRRTSVTRMKGRVLRQRPLPRKRLRTHAKINLVVGKGPSTHSSPSRPSVSFRLTVSLSGNGAGSVSSSPAGISCGPRCSYSYPNGTAVTLKATASPGSVFSGWSGACTGRGTSCTTTMNRARSVTAVVSVKTPVSTNVWTNVLSEDFRGVTSLPSFWCRYRGHDGLYGGNFLPSHVYVAGGYLHLLSSYQSSGPEGAAWYQGGMSLTGGCGGSKVPHPPSAVDSRLTVRMRIVETGNRTAASHRNILRWPDSGVWPRDGEEDMWESGASLTTNVSTFFHYGTRNTQISWLYPPLDKTQWHTYRFQRLKDVISVYIDDMNNPLHVYKGNSTTLPERLKHWVFQQQCPATGCPARTTDTEDWQIASITVDDA